jgi:multidrug resistance protein
MSDLEKGEDSKPSAASCEESYNDPVLSKETGIQNDSTAEKSHIELTQRSPPLDTEESESSNIVSWDSPEDPANPLNWPSWRRWTLIILASGVTFMAGLSSSMFAPGVPRLLVEFNSTNSVLGSFVVTVFVLGLAFGPLVWAPLAEIYGRLIVQHVGCAGCLIFTIACAVSKSLSVLIGMRLLQGTFAAASLTNGGAIIADMVRQEERGFAMAMYTLGILLGPSVGPVAGGFLAAAKGWRWVFWVISITVGLPLFIILKT